ncbi:hypothetical protein ACH4JS_04950 [Streptomyces sp. NPDC017638]|uniref:hypothetical protein n=1 Tax=Streptomyces sp. NPDC017638 TaxID=3365004 RepID=UPI0037A00324
MTTIAVTGHMDLAEDTVPLVRAAQDDLLKPYAGTTASRRSRPTEATDEVLVLPHDTTDRRAYEAANAVLLQRADRLMAVWDGEPPGGKVGGTADTVMDARATGIPVDVSTE